MNKNNLRKLTAVILSVAALSGVTMMSYANATDEPYSVGGVSPRYVAIANTVTGLELGSWGKMECDAATEVRDGYIAGVTAELQQYNGGWKTIATWSDSDWDYASIAANYYVVSGYDYRLKTTHYSYDSNWKQLESTVEYSNTIWY